MPSSQAAATERRNDKTVAHEPPKLKTTLKTPPKQATNPLQFVKVGPCSLYRSAQEQLQKVEETKKIKQEVRDDPEDWQSNLDNWKSSRRKRQEHIIERVVEVKKLELEEHDRLRRRSKTFSEMMEERGSRGRKLSMSLAMYHEDDVNDLSDLGIGTSSGKSSVSGDTHDDTHSVMSDRDSEIEKNHSDMENASLENDNNNENDNAPSELNDEIPQLPLSSPPPPPPPQTTTMTTISSCQTSDETTTSIHDYGQCNKDENNICEYETAIDATASLSPEPEAEYTYEGAIRGYVSRVSQNMPRRSFISMDSTIRDNSAAESSINEEDAHPTRNDDEQNVPIVKVDVPKRREMFERASRNFADNTRANNINNNNNNNNNHSQNNNNNNNNININNNSGNLNNSKLRIKDRPLSLEKQKSDNERDKNGISAVNRLSGDMSSIRERLTHLEKQTSERENKVGIARPFDDATVMENSELIEDNRVGASPSVESMRKNDLASVSKCKKRNFSGNDERSRITSPRPSETMSVSPDSEYRGPTTASRAIFHRSLDSLDTDVSSVPDIFERVQSLEELDYTTRYPASSSSAERFNDTDRDDSGIHTADASSSVSQADDEGATHDGENRRKRDDCLSSLARVIREETTINADDDARESTTTIESTIVNETENEMKSIVDQQDESTIGQDNERRTNQPNEIDDLVVTESSPGTICQLLLDENQRVTRHAEITNDQLAPSSPSALSKEIPQFNPSNDEELINGLTFPLRPPTSVEPPKEKPPPPPTELSEDEENPPIDEPLKRLNSTRRIKKELRTRRSDFLGIEGMNEDYPDRQLSLTKPPDMIAILAVERRAEQRNRRSYDTDSNYERDSSHERDSGVELGHTEDWSKQPVSPDMSQHSRQSSEPFGNASVTSSEEDEITKKEREIIDVLEKEEQWRYGNDRHRNSDIGEKLARKLRQLEEEKMQLERERVQEAKLRRRRDENLRIMEDDEEAKVKVEKARELEKENLREQREIARQRQEAKRFEEKKIQEQDELIRAIKSEELGTQKDNNNSERRITEGRSRDDEQKQIGSSEMVFNNRNEDDEFASGEVLRVERELLQLEQEELKRRRTNVAYREQRKLQLAEQLHEQWQSLQDVANGTKNDVASSRGDKSRSLQAPVNYRSSMPNLWLHDAGQRRRPPPPPIPPLKPSRLVEQMQRDVTIRNSRIPSADSIPQQVEGKNGGTTINAGQQMTKQTFQALSAVPRSRIVKGDQWVQRRKSDLPRGTLEYNYQHWLVQEAEQRRIGEQNQRSAFRRVQQHVTGTSVPYTAQPSSSKTDVKPLPDSIIQTLTQRVQNRAHERPPPPPPQRRRLEQSSSHEHLSSLHHQQTPQQHIAMLQHRKIHQFTAANNTDSQEKMLSVSGKKKCSHCGDELGRGAAMIIESLRLFYHMECFKCCVCHVRLGDGLMGTDVRVRNHKLHCHNCYSSDDGVKFSCV